MTTMPVVWCCPYCQQPVQLTASVHPTPDRRVVRVEMNNHINAHLIQHADD